MPAHADPHMYREDGELFRALHGNNHASKTVLFNDMQHGWVTRGNLEDHKVKRDYEHAIELMRAFFKAH
jgi:predicted DNA-binding ArsR family transcriptional regulator